MLEDVYQRLADDGYRVTHFDQGLVIGAYVLVMEKEGGSWLDQKRGVWLPPRDPEDYPPYA